MALFPLVFLYLAVLGFVEWRNCRRDARVERRWRQYADLARMVDEAFADTVLP